MDINYIVEVDGQSYGPYDLNGVRQVGLFRDTKVKYSTAGTEWRNAEDFPELRNFLSEEIVEEPTLDLYQVQYYYKEGEGVYGPLSIIELSYMNVCPSSLVSIDGGHTFVFASEISGLLDLLAYIVDSESKDLAEQLENERRNTENERISKAELEKVVEEQETEILRLESQISEMKDAQNEVVETDFDFTKSYEEQFGDLLNRFASKIGDLGGLKLQQEEGYTRVFSSVEKERDFYLGSYARSMSEAKIVMQSLTALARTLQERQEELLHALDCYLCSRRSKLNKEQIQREKQIINEFKGQIQSVSDSAISGKDMTISSLRQSLADKKKQLGDTCRQQLVDISKQTNDYKVGLKNFFRDFQSKSLLEIEMNLRSIEDCYNAYFVKRYDTAGLNEKIWEKIDNKESMPSSSLFLRSDAEQFVILDRSFVLRKKVFLNLYNNKHLVLRYDSASEILCDDVVNSIIARSLASCSSGGLNISMIDSKDMNGTSDILKRLNRSVFAISVRPEDIRRRLDVIEQRIEGIVQNLLLSPIRTLADFNQSKQAKEPYHLIVIKGFPLGFGGESVYLLNKILRNGIRAGVNVIIMVNKQALLRDDNSKQFNSVEWDAIKDSVIEYDFTSTEVHAGESKQEFEKISDTVFNSIVDYVNAGFEIKSEEVISISDYLPPIQQWWSRKSAAHIEIPFGVEDTKSLQSLYITQESGQNSAVVIGIPGSGKSVFLHSIIVNATVNYSPDELNLYLIDFSGVEFNTYALHDLPHARVIAPEAEREFGLSILTELVEEGARRMAVCRDNDVSNIVDLKIKKPDIVMPRLLVIIDEFQKLFEIASDFISRDANVKICTIIQEFRKFGINLILATQKLPSSSILPKDLIANRIVFRSQPSDFSDLISLMPNTRMPQLSTGECIYNSQSGSAYDNHKVKSFYVGKKDLDSILDEISAFATEKTVKPIQKVIFRSNELPNFATRRRHPSHQNISEFPSEVGIYLGENIAIEKYDVFAKFQAESGNNMLVIGGESDVAEKVAIYATLSAMDAHIDKSASFYILNFIKQSDPLQKMPENYMPAGIPFEAKFATKSTDVIAILSEIKEIMNTRLAEENGEFHNIYLSIYAFQFARMFDKVAGKHSESVSEAGQLLDEILKNGPLVGIYTILQVDELMNLSRISSNIQLFQHKVVLQMEENDSMKLIGSGAANKLFVMNRPSSKYRCFYCDKSKNILKKFKPYK